MGVGGYEDIQLHRTVRAEGFDAAGDGYDEALPHEERRFAAGRPLPGRLPAGSRVRGLGRGTGSRTGRRPTRTAYKPTGAHRRAGSLPLAGRHAPRTTCHQARIAGPPPGVRRPEPGRPGLVTTLVPLLTSPQAETPSTLRTVRDPLVPGGPFTLATVEAGVTDPAIPFLGNTIRVSGYLRDELRQVDTDAGFAVLEEDTYAYTPHTTEVPPEEQRFLHSRRPA
ncbi:SAM-dependent methyltransferase [Streptomyces sp. ME03-5709C]|nr:SAM-dependent methyltransferase [Streptomyces sp. ME03-5709C]